MLDYSLLKLRNRKGLPLDMIDIPTHLKENIILLGAWTEPFSLTTEIGYKKECNIQLHHQGLNTSSVAVH